MKAEKILKNIRDFIEKIKSDKKAFVIIIVGSLIMLAVLFADVPKSQEKIGESTESQSYEEKLEEKLCSIISKINKAGKVRVMLTFESSTQTVYAYDTDESFEEKSGDGGIKKTKNEYIIVKRNGNEDGLSLKNIYPKVMGAAIVCEGASDPIIKGQIISVVSALFDINSTNISVAEMAD